MRELWLIDAADRASLERYLTSTGLVQPDELPIEIARAGDGNMNLVLRVSTRRPRSFVVKQGRPWVAKYPHIPAPLERTLVEAAFYEAVRDEPAVASRMPAVLRVDAADHILVLEDVGSDGDFTTMYSDGTMPSRLLGALLDWLSALARVPFGEDLRASLANRAMRALNYEHIFVFPLRDANGLDLDAIDPGLLAAARGLAHDRAYCAAVHALGERYLSDGAALVHGDFFPGSWLHDAGGAVRIIDPEFCFPGDPEFDYGVLAAHLMLAMCPHRSLEAVSDAAAERGLDMVRLAGYAGVEIMRRLIGVAQLPIGYGIDAKRTLLERSRRLLLEPHKGLA